MSSTEFFHVSIHTVNGPDKGNKWHFETMRQAKSFARRALATRRKDGAELLDDEIDGNAHIFYQGQTWTIKTYEA